ncbi:hypothetical protein I5Q34_34170 [Streptomyces sp. AV19]|uniref:hypothetical protein n=1 Tax=Streptomyces sp. AV19 TaxID=2793068 RepID=UPI0018FEDD99|nr:hypothetical protein [Streptomyces sp. AV19]MBH1939247.1 hypothetical protein [Streptomyces sp. AV19]MDG4531653.1 hypothetical protein [Streptomyces sp. AV19]
MNPRPCYWHEEPDGSRSLIPGCAARALDPDAECTCTLAEHHIADLHQQLDDVRRRYHRFERWHDCVMSALRAHPDGGNVYRAAQKEFHR